MTPFEYALLALGAAAAGLTALVARPAWPLSLGLAAAMLNGHWDDAGIPVPFDRLLLAAAILSVFVRERRGRGTPLQTRPIDWLLVLVAGYAVMSALLAATLTVSESRFALIDAFGLLPFLLFYVAPIVYREARDRAVLLGVLCVMGLYLGLTAIFETVGLRELVFPRYVNDPDVGLHFARARGPFAEAVANGLVLYACVVAALIAAHQTGERRIRGFALFVAALCLLGTLLTLTRGIWLGVIAGSLVALLSTPALRRWTVPAGAAVALMVIVALAAIPGLSERASARQADQTPVYDRRNNTEAALRMIEERPLTGFGWGRFAEESGDHFRQSLDYPLTIQRQSHNVYLTNLVELGIPGGLLWLAALLTALAAGILHRGPPWLRPWQLGLAAFATCYLVTALTTPLGFALPAMLLWLWAGIAWIGIRRPA